ncbi:MAG: hypothetical protein AAF683_14865, partial [Pseudomonadota bacterium]
MSSGFSIHSIGLFAGTLSLLVLAACSEDISEPDVRILTEQNLVDILVGSCIQSTRNCDPSESITEVKASLADGNVF